MKFFNLFAVLAAISLATAAVYPDKVKAAVDQLQFYLLDDGQKVSKVEATKSLLLNDGATVWNCYQVELTDKLTLKKRKR